MTSDQDNTIQGWEAKLNEFDKACADYGYYRSDSPEAIKARARADALHRELLAAFQPQHMTEDRATQGWRKQRWNLGQNAAFTGEAYEWHIVDPTSRRIAVCTHEADADLILAALQRPWREAELQAKLSESQAEREHIVNALAEAYHVIKDQLAAAEKVAGLNAEVAADLMTEKAALVEALKEIQEWARQHSQDALMFRIAALISPPGLSEGDVHQ